jgi:Fic family protein
MGSSANTMNYANFVPPPVHEMHEALDALEKYLHLGNDYPPLVRLAFIHYQFEAIHPFLDGNGRIGRLLISLLLVNWNLLPLPLLYLSAYFERHRQDYYDLLLAVSERGAWREWLAFFLRGVAEQARDANARAKRLQDLQIEWRRQLQQARASGMVLGIVDALFEDPATSASRIVERYQVSHQAAMKVLRRLQELNIVRETTDRKRNRLYLASEIVRILE